uniref:Uncharacterized protein n=1 Tax=Timema monikensis TaxID=170555 RepID=A0A7R9DYH6_9NEOP|nr:unnamed protein product [Timema monikensis]
MGDSNTFIKPSPVQPLLTRKQVKRSTTQTPQLYNLSTVESWLKHQDIPSKPSTKVYISKKDVGYCMAPASSTEFNKATDWDAPFILTRASISDLMDSLKTIKESEDHFNSGMKLFQQGLSILENVLLENMKLRKSPEISKRVHNKNLNITLPQSKSIPATFVKEHREVPTNSSMVLATGRSDDNILVNNVHQSASKTVKQNNALSVDQSESIDVDFNTDVGVSGQDALSSKHKDLSDVALKCDSSLPKLKKRPMCLKDCSVFLERISNGKKGKILHTNCRTNTPVESTTDEHIHELNGNIGGDGQKFTRTGLRKCRILNNIMSSSDEDELVDVVTQDCTMLQSQRKPKNKISVYPAKDHKYSQSLQKDAEDNDTGTELVLDKTQRMSHSEGIKALDVALFYVEQQGEATMSQSTRVEKLPKADVRLHMDSSHQANMTVGNHGRLSLRHRPSLLVGMFSLSNTFPAQKKLDKSHEKETVAYKLNKTNITPQHNSTKRGRSNVQKDSIDCISKDDAENEKENDWSPIMPITTEPLSGVSSGQSTTPLANYYNIIDGSLNSLHSAHSSPGMPMFHSNKEATHMINKYVKDKQKVSKRSRPIDNTTKVTEDNPKPWSEMKKAVKKLPQPKPGYQVLFPAGILATVTRLKLGLRFPLVHPTIITINISLRKRPISSLKVCMSWQTRGYRLDDVAARASQLFSEFHPPLPLKHLERVMAGHAIPLFLHDTTSDIQSPNELAVVQSNCYY